jgi:hypothetical protein
MIEQATGPLAAPVLAPFPPPAGRALYGVDFSGARGYARKLWLAAWRPGRAATLRCGAELAGFDYAALVARIAASPGVWLLDFPFGLAAELAAAQGLPTADWPAFVRAFAARYADAAAFYAATHPLPRGNREAKRQCDRQHRTPMAPHNRRVCRQTFHGLRDVLAPLLAAHRARVALLPWDAAVAGARPVWVAEGCPASVLRGSGLLAAGYKGRGAAALAARARLLAALAARGVPLDATAQARALADAEGDALDALLLLPAAARCADPAAAARLAPAYVSHAARQAALAAAGRAAEMDVYC